jgi:hypothetical protein
MRLKRRAAVGPPKTANSHRRRYRAAARLCLHRRMRPLGIIRGMPGEASQFLGARQPAASASATVQNHRLPESILILPYQRSPGW